jgi:hypothetical protein
MAVVLIAILAGGAILAGFFYVPGLIVRPEQITDGDRAMLIVAGDFLRWMPELVVHNDCEQLTKTRQGETVRLEYRYNALAKEPPAYVRCEVIAAPDAESAAATYGEQVAEPIPIDRVDRSAKNEQFAWGAESEFGELTRDGATCGRYFHGRKHDRVYSIVIYGVDTSFSQEFIDLLTPLLEELESYKP